MKLFAGGEAIAVCVCVAVGFFWSCEVFGVPVSKERRDILNEKAGCSDRKTKPHLNRRLQQQMPLLDVHREGLRQSPLVYALLFGLSVF